jgi:hypothetical protein
MKSWFTMSMDDKMQLRYTFDSKSDVVVSALPNVTEPDPPAARVKISQPLSKSSRKKQLSNPALRAFWHNWPVFVNRAYWKLISHWWKIGNTVVPKSYWGSLGQEIPVVNYKGVTKRLTGFQFFMWYNLIWIQFSGYTWNPFPGSPAPAPSYPQGAWDPPLAPMIVGWSEEAPGEYYLDVQAPAQVGSYRIATWLQQTRSATNAPCPSPRRRGVSNGPYAAGQFAHALITYGGVLKPMLPGTRGTFHAAAFNLNTSQPSALASTDFYINA